MKILERQLVVSLESSDVSALKLAINIAMDAENDDMYNYLDFDSLQYILEKLSND
jgi:hypothetical protein